MKIHELDIYPEYFLPVKKRIKTFEIRRNQSFGIGDILVLKEFLPNQDKYTGRVVYRRVSYITDYAQKENYVVLGVI